MKKNSLFDECIANVAPEVKAEVDLNVEIANRISDLLKEKKLTQREFASLMGKRESEISRWLTGSHGFTTTTLAKISVALGEPVVVVKKEPQVRYSFLQDFAFAFSLAGLERITGVNQKQLGHYISGYRKPSEKTVRKIESSIHAFSKQLEAVRFV